MAVELEELAARLQRVEDELAIRRVILTYGPSADAGVTDRAGALWADDGEYDWDPATPPLEGRNTVGAMLAGRQHQSLIARRRRALRRTSADRARRRSGHHAVVLVRAAPRRRPAPSTCGDWALPGGSSSASTERGASTGAPIASSTRPAPVVSSSATPYQAASGRTRHERRRLDGKVAVITGASTGLGPVMARASSREGAQVLLAARREELVPRRPRLRRRRRSPCAPT